MNTAVTKEPAASILYVEDSFLEDGSSRFL
jgi:hypothetical protein